MTDQQSSPPSSHYQQAQPPSYTPDQQYSTNTSPPALQYGFAQPSEQSENQPLLANQQPRKGIPRRIHHHGQRPENHLLMSVVACLCCFWPTGIIAIIYSLQVDDNFTRGNLQGAEDAARKAKKWSIITIIIGIVVFCIYVGLVIAFTALRVSALNNNDN